MTRATEIEVLPAEQALPQPAAPTNILSVIERIATDPNIDVTKMQALLQMRADEEDRIRRLDREDRETAAKRAWLRDFAKVQAEIEPIVRGQLNTHTKKKFADLADIDRAVTPILAKHGFSTTSVELSGAPAGHIRERLTIGHAEGHEMHYEGDFPLDSAGSQGAANKTAIQAKGSTRTYARRYLKTGALDLAFEDDNDGNVRRDDAAITEDQFRALRDLLEESGANEANILAVYGVETLFELPAKMFAPAAALLRQRIAAAKKRAAEAKTVEGEGE